MVMINPRVLSWRHDGKNTDGSAFDASRFGGWELEVNGQAVLSVPVGWEQDGEYEAPIVELELNEGTYTARLRLVTREGVTSEWSNAVEFLITKVPSGPFDLAVA